MVPGPKQFLLFPVPNQESKHPPQPLGNLSAPFFVTMQKDFCICMCLKNVASCNQFFSQRLVIIDFAIKKNGEDVYIMPPGRMTADTTNTKGKDAVINVVVKGNNIPIPSAGTYIVTLKVDDKVWESDLHVVKVEDMK